MHHSLFFAIIHPDQLSLETHFSCPLAASAVTGKDALLLHHPTIKQLLSWLTKSSILKVEFLPSDHKGISSVRHMNQFSFEKLVILSSIDGSFPSRFRFFRNQFLLLDLLLHLQLERSLCTAGTPPPSFDWVAPYHLETCHSPHYNEFIHSLYHAILYMQNLDRTM